MKRAYPGKGDTSPGDETFTGSSSTMSRAVGRVCNQLGFREVAEMRTPPSAELQASALSADPIHSLKPAHQTAIDVNYSDAVRQLHRELVSAASNGAPGQLNLLKFWIECGGKRR